MRLRTLSAFLVLMMLFAATTFAAQSTRPASEAAIQLPKANIHAAQETAKVNAPQADSNEVLERRKLDPGIYLPTYADGQSSCAAIRSYNFTPGDNPKLESVTTCTPARPHSVYRTNDENKKRPQGPVLQMISSPQSSSAK